jgi:hypothetical protein
MTGLTLNKKTQIHYRITLLLRTLKTHDFLGLYTEFYYRVFIQIST